MERAWSSKRATNRFVRAALIVGLGMSVAGCDLIIKALTAIGLAPREEVRIAGSSYFTLDKKDSKDGYSAQDGYLCIVHNPGCGVKGNDGHDKFFATSQLPAGVEVIKMVFTPLPTYHGGSGGYGSYGSQLTPGAVNGVNTTDVSWANSCVGDYGKKNIYYQVSFVVRRFKDQDLGETTFDPSSTQTAPQCQPPETVSQPTPPPTTPSPSGWAAKVVICNPGTQSTSGVLHIEASITSPLPGATGSDSMKEDISLTFPPSGGLASDAPFATQTIYKQGTWKITAAKVQGVTGNLAGLPLTKDLPGGLGTPLLDFTGGRCAVG